MKALILLLIIGCTAFLISALAKYLLRVIDKKKTAVEPQKEYNPYIAYHKIKNKNDQNYDDYLKWLQANGGGVPVEKRVSAEDKKAETKIRNLF
jgi:hypothetical protein